MNTILILLPFLLYFFNALILRMGPSSFSKETRLVSLLLSVSAFVIFTIPLFATFSTPDFVQLSTWSWWSLGNVSNGLTLDVGIFGDIWSAQMCMMVAGVSLLIQLYSAEYMKDDPRINRFLSFISLFSASMLGLVIGDGLFSGFIFWELMGVCSFFLISHDLDDSSATIAAVKAFLITKLGDVFFLLGIILLANSAGTFNYLELIDFYRENGAEKLSLPLICLMIGIASKSAQAPFYLWLPGAMKGPTPCSALIHAATMVAGGVWVLFRTRPLFVMADMLDWLVYLGGVSAIIGSIKAIFQNEIKGVLAYSTIGHLGLMIFGIGAASGEAAILHLTVHAYFKAGLFLAAGIVLHAFSHENLNGKLQITKIFFIILTLSLIGFPFFSGHLSKDVLISLSWEHGFFAKIVGVSMLTLTPIYAMKLFASIFLVKKSHSIGNNNSEQWSLYVHLPLLVLSLASLSPIFKLIYPVLSNLEHEVVSVFPLWLTPTLAIFFGAIGLLLAKSNSLKLSTRMLSKTPMLDFVFKDLMWIAFGQRLALVTGRFDMEILDKHFVDGWKSINRHIFAIVGWFDVKVIDAIVDLVGLLSRLLNLVLRIFQNGKIQFYLIIVLVSVFAIWIKLVRT